MDVPPDAAADRPRFRADGGSRLGPAGPEVFLAFEAPYSELFFRPSGSRFRSRFDLILLLLDGKRQVGGDLFSETIEVLDRRDARDPAARVWRVLPVAAKPGNYGAEVVLRETSAGRQTSVAWKIEVPDYGSLPLSISSLWISESGRRRTRTAPCCRPSAGCCAVDLVSRWARWRYQEKSTGTTEEANPRA